MSTIILQEKYEIKGKRKQNIFVAMFISQNEGKKGTHKGSKSGIPLLRFSDFKLLLIIEAFKEEQ